MLSSATRRRTPSPTPGPVARESGAEVGVAGVLEQATLRLLEIVGKAAHLRGEGGAGAAHLAEAARAHQHALVRIGPVDPPDLDGRIVEEPGGEVVLVEAVGAERALHLQVVDGEADGVLDLGGGEAGGGGERGAIEGEVAVVIGEALHQAVTPRQAPAPGERGGAGVEVGLEGWGEGFHGEASGE